MPKKTQNTRTAPGAGRGLSRRTVRQKAGSPAAAAGRSKEDSAIIADSLATLKLKSIPGTEVFFVHENLMDPDNGEELSLQLLHEDLQVITSNMRAILKGDPLTVDLSEKGMSLATVVAWNLEQVRRMIPKDFDFNIEYGHIKGHGEGHFLIAYKECAWQPTFLVFPVGSLLKGLRRQNKALHDLFLSFLRSFTKSTGINLWWQGFIGHSFSVFQERYDDMSHEMDEEQRASWLKDLQNYQNKDGEAYRYQNMISKAPVLTAEELRSRATRFKNPLASIITYGAKLMNGILYYKEFIYYPEDNADDVCHLELDGQQAFVWDITDNFFADYEEDLNAMAHEGVQMPVVSMEITHKTKSFDFQAMRQKALWPNDLNLFFNHANKRLNDYERKNRSAHKKI